MTFGDDDLGLGSLFVIPVCIWRESRKVVT